MILHLFIPIFWSILLTVLLTPPLIWLAFRFNYLDVPFSAPHKTHNAPVPKIGGVAISLVVFLLAFLNRPLLSKDVLAILIGSMVIVGFGIWDDLKGLSALSKLSGQIVATILLWVFGIYIRMFGELMFLNIFVTFLWMVGITNAFNLVDSMDGLAVGLSAIASAFFMLVTVQAQQPALSNLSAVLFGSCIGMLLFNIQPARTFLGDAGAQFLGFVLAALAIAYTPRGLPQPSSWFVPILLVSVPIFDTTLVVVSRLRRRVPIYQGGQDHTYHRLVKLGLPPSHAVMLMHIAAILSGCLAFIALPQSTLWANFLFALAVLFGLGALLWLETKQQ